MTLRKAISLTQVSRATAWRELAELVDLQAIEPIGEGRSHVYRIHWPGREPSEGEQHQVQRRRRGEVSFWPDLDCRWAR